MSIVTFNADIKEIKWMIKMIQDNPGHLFNSSSSEYNNFWKTYVNYIERIGLPPEMSIPYSEEYYITDTTKNYSDWYKTTYEEFIIKINDVERILIDYISGRG